MKKKNGFTIVELLAVISLLSLIMVLMVPTVTNIRDNSNKSMRDSKINILLSNAETYGNNYINDFQKCTGSPVNGDCIKNMDGMKSIMTANGYDLKDANEALEDPVKGGTFTGRVIICYSEEKIDVHAKYVEDGEPSCP